MKNTTTKPTIRLLPYLMLAIMITLVSCKGPSGTDGAKGSKGDAGAIGPAGEDGSMIYADTGAPTANIGTEGDYYLDNSTGELYGPKNDKGWGSPISLKGPSGEDGKDGEDGQDGQDGANGQDGSQIYSGTGAPDPGIGATDDYYLDKSSYDLFGPKTDSGWGTPINLKGTANVMYSDWIKPTNWDKDTVYGEKVRYFDIAANALTQDVLDKAVVLVYADFVGGSINQLPIEPAGDRLRFYFELTLQNLRIGYLDPDNSGTDPGAVSLGNRFRYVIIPGGVNVSAANTKDMTYQKVKKRFGIRE